MSCPSFINWLFLHLLLKPVGIFFSIIFGDMKNIRYLCNMNAKNLYSNTNWESTQHSHGDWHLSVVPNAQVPVPLTIWEIMYLSRQSQLMFMQLKSVMRIQTSPPRNSLHQARLATSITTE